MKLAVCTDVYADLSYTDMLDQVRALGMDAVEMTAGGWGACTHVPTKELLASEEKRVVFMQELARRDMRISALNCSCNQLWPTERGREWSDSMYDCARLAALLGVKKLVCMSGLPAGNPTDTTPVWINSSVTMTEYLPSVVQYQWETAIAWWKAFAAFCESQGIERIAIEAFPNQLVFNVESLLMLREAIGTLIGINLDPSHLMVQGADPIAAARALGHAGAIYHVHGKDARLERSMVEVNGLGDWKPVTDTANRYWNYVAVGCGRDLQWWKEFFSVVRMMGYDGDVSLEMEDLTMSREAGMLTSVSVLEQTISR